MNIGTPARRMNIGVHQRKHAGRIERVTDMMNDAKQSVTRETARLASRMQKAREHAV